MGIGSRRGPGGLCRPPGPSRAGLLPARGIGSGLAGSSDQPRASLVTGEGADLLLKTLRLFIAGDVIRIPQNDAEITLAPKLKKEDGRIDWDCTAEDIYNRIRGLNPWPCCRCIMPSGSGVRVLKALVEKVVCAPGEVIDVSGDGPLIGTAAGSLRLLEVQPDGKKVMSGSAYLCGRALSVGDILPKVCNEKS